MNVENLRMERMKRDVLGTSMLRMRSAHERAKSECNRREGNLELMAKKKKEFTRRQDLPTFHNHPFAYVFRAAARPLRFSR